MALDWSSLTNLTGNREFIINRVMLPDTRVLIEGEFDLPPLAKLSYEDQIFVAEFIRAHGSIKHMEESFGVSYPTIKNRLNAIAGKLEFVKLQPAGSVKEVLDKLENGEINADEAAKRMKR
ncbi:MAG: DUF2089 family protein [Chitinivibrionales bacterium]|nr:DUF2089 family protein [Chitinivibrionales bacterium]